MKSRGVNKLLSPFITVIIIAFTVVLSIQFVAGFEKSFTKNETDTLQKNVSLAAVSCYATEGFYPKDLKYLCENYGLYLNEDTYVYHYVYLGSNLMPEIFVFKLSVQK